MTALYIILGVLALIALLLVLKIQIYYTFDEDATLKLRVLFFTLTVIPAPQKKKKEQKKKKPKQPKQPKEQKEKKPKHDRPEELSYLEKVRKKRGLSGLVSLLTGLARLTAGTLKYLASHTVIKKLDVGIAMNSGDAASTAVAYGRLCSVVYPAVNVIAAATVCKSYNVSIEPIFDSEQNTWATADVHAYLRLFFLVVEGVKAGVRLLLLRVRVLKG